MGLKAKEDAKVAEGKASKVSAEEFKKHQAKMKQVEAELSDYKKKAATANTETQSAKATLDKAKKEHAKAAAACTKRQEDDAKEMEELKKKHSTAAQKCVADAKEA